MDDLYWCREGCGFVDKDHRCEQWCHIYRIPGEARARIRAEARAEAMKEAADRAIHYIDNHVEAYGYHVNDFRAAILADETREEREAEDALTIKQLTADLLYIGGMVERGTGKPLEQSTPITKQVLEYIKSLESRADEPKEERIEEVKE